MARIAQERVNRIVYSNANPPPDADEAKRHLDDVEKQIASIVASLAVKTIKDYAGSESQFNDWRRRANSALSLFRSEAKFLTDWIAKNGPTSEGHVQGQELEDAVRVLSCMTEAFFRTAKSVGVQYSVANPPKFMDDVKDRRIFLASVKIECEGFIRDLKLKAHELRVPPSKLNPIKSRVSMIIDAIEKEFLYFRNLLRNNGRLPDRLTPSLGCGVSKNSPAVDDIVRKIDEAKQRLGMHSGAIIIWLSARLKRLNDSLPHISLSPEEQDILQQILDYSELLEKCKKENHAARKQTVPAQA